MTQALVIAVLGSNGGILLALILLWIRVDGFPRSLTQEHEMLVRDYCERNGIRPQDLPTRRR